MTDVGKIMVLPKAAWNSSTTYEILDSVTHGGAAYISKINDNLNHIPSGNTDNYWFKYAEDGFTPTITQSKDVSTGITTITITNATGTQTVQISDGEDGESVTIVSITKVNGVTTIILEDKNGQQTITINDGVDGKGIASFVKNTEGLVDEYVMTYTDGTSTTITVTNGKGITSIVKTSSGTDNTGRVVDTYTITYNDGTTQTYTITNGKDGTGTGDMEKSVYDTDNDGKVDAAEVADSVEWSNVQNKPFSALGSTLEVNSVEVGGVNVPTLDVKTMTGANSQNNGSAGLVPAPESGDVEKFLGGNGLWRAISPMTGATSSADGQAGTVPKPLQGDQEKYLMGDGTWQTLNNMTGATSLVAGTKGLVPAPSAGDNVKFLSGDGTFKEVDTMTGATSLVAGTKGLVPAPASSDTEKFLRGDGTWQKADSLGTKVSATVSGDTLAFTNAALTGNVVVDGPYIADVLMGLTDLVVSGTTITYTLDTTDANGKTAYIWIRPTS